MQSKGSAVVVILRPGSASRLVEAKKEATDFSTLTAKGQVTISKHVRDALGLKRGDLVSRELEGESVRLRVVPPIDLG